MLKLKKIPYGVSNFKKLKKESLYIDKTQFIELLEDKYEFLSFLRPRRFGKSLFISTLSYYYDEYYKNDFDLIFRDTYIGKNPTKLKSSYRILFLEFSGIETTRIESIHDDFSSKIDTLLRSYLDKYKYDMNLLKIIENKKSPQKKIEAFFEIVKNDKVYLLIDDVLDPNISQVLDPKLAELQYDNFANSLLGESITDFKSILGKGGFVRTFYEVIKTATQIGIVDRMFVTGVTQITMDSMTSGFNIIEDITKDKEFNELVGFTLKETKKVLESIFSQCENIDKEKIITDMIKLYNGYKFNVDAKETIFNSTMVMYFVKKFDTDNCKYPRELLDVNVASDYRKIMQLFAIGDIEDNYKVLKELIDTNQTVATLKSKIEFDKGFYRDDFVTLLYSMGFITIKDMFLDNTVFTIPNYTIKTLYFEYFKIELEKRSEIKFNTRTIKNALTELALNKNLSPFQEEVKNVINLLSNRDYIKFEEKHLKVILLTVLNMATFFYIKSEAEYNNNYPDIMLLKQEPFEVKFQYLFELKWVKKGVNENHKNSWKNKKIEGISQVERYKRLSDIKDLKNLHSFLIISDGENLKLIEVN
jgi:hypothetical protein